MTALSPDWLLRVQQAALNASLPSSRDAILSMLPDQVKASMPHAGSETQSATQLQDLTKLNDLASKGDSEPLKLWLRTAELLSAAYRASAQTFAEAREVLDLPSAATSKSPPHTHQDPPAQSEVRPADIAKFLTSAFTTRELHQFTDLNLPEIVQSIAWNAPMAHVSFDVVQVLRRRGLLAEFLDALAGELPGRAQEIEKLRGI